MALTKVNRGGLNTGIADSSNATFLTATSAEGVTLAGTLAVTGIHTVGTNAVATSDGGAATTSIVQGLAKAWFHIVNGGASTIALGDSFNATSITDGGTGIYNFNIANDMANAVYSLQISSQAGAGFPDKPQINSQAAGSFQCRQAHASDEVDSAIYNATVNGDLA